MHAISPRTSRPLPWLALTLLLSSPLILSVATAQQHSPTKGPLQYANGLVGTAPLDRREVIGNAPPPGERLYSGLVSPGAVLPHGSTQLNPINNNLDVAYPGGVQDPYFYPNRTIMGFTTGVEGGPTIMPVVGDWTVPPERRASVYDKKTEVASPGYYSVSLEDFATRAELTVTQWTGAMRFSFPTGNRSHILLDTGRTGGSVEIVGDHTLHGTYLRGRMGAKHDLTLAMYFAAEFSQPFASFGTFRQVPPDSTRTTRPDPILGSKIVDTGSRTMAGPFAGAYLDFTTKQGEPVLVKIAYGPTLAVAGQRLRDEQPGWDFDRIHRDAEAAWATKLDRIEVSGGTEHERMFFYSTLMHSFASPRLLARAGEPFMDHEGKVHTASYNLYGPVPYWDTGRDQVVLLTLLEPKVKEEILRSELDDARATGYMATSFHGDHAVQMYLGDWERGLNFDWPAVYEYLRKNAMDPNGPRRYLDEYMRQHWISDLIPPGNPSPPYAGGKAGAATTLEYSWDDAAMAVFAKKLGKEDDARMFLARSQYYRNVFDSKVGFMRGKTEDGKWIAPFDPQEPYYNFMMKEASGWSTLWLVPHDVQGLTELLGGRERFAAKLDEFFTTPYTPKGICRDCTGLIGQYVQGNQPDQQAAYFYDWAGQPWKTQKLVRRILTELYGSDKTGYGFPGMDDQGSTSSWYVLSAMGFYTVNPADPNYILGSPLFNDVKLHLGNGKVFEVAAINNSERNVYIQSATLNGKPWNKPWFSHADIANGGRLVLRMGPEPNTKWGAAPEDAPPAMASIP
jgi:predicted alpha-1,2-mannosidase